MAFVLMNMFYAGQIIDRLGRRGTLMFVSPLFVGGWLMIAYANTVTLLFIGRFLTGFSTGLTSIVCPIYISETVPASQRGIMGSGFQLFITIGLMLSYLIGKYTFWPWLAVYSSLPVIAMLLIVGALHETPTWLALKNRNDEAARAHTFFRQLPPESAPIIVKENDGNCCQTFRSFKNKAILFPSLLCLALFFFQEFSGVNALLFYTVTIFRAAGSTIDDYSATIIVGLIQVIATFLACLFTDRLGRRVLLIVSGLIMALSMLVLSLHHYFSIVNGPSFTQSFGWLPLFSLCSFIAAFAFGYGPLPWLIMSEILPPQIRGFSSSLAQVVNWGGCFIVTEMYKSFADMYGETITYSIFALISFISVLFVSFLLPETKGKTLEEIQEIFSLTQPVASL